MMQVRTAAFILLVCFASGEALAGQGRARLGSYLFGDYVVRPPRAIPHARSLGRSAMAAVTPLPRARPAAAQPEAGIAVVSEPASAVRAPEGRSGQPAEAGFPPVVTLE
jgi:hypothetical protein